MITAGKLSLVVIDYRRSTSSDIHRNLFRTRVYRTEKRSKRPRGASSSLETGKIFQTNPTTSTSQHITFVQKWFSFTTRYTTQNSLRRLWLSYQRFSLLNSRYEQFCYRIRGDKPKSPVQKKSLMSMHVWCHCKSYNIQTVKLTCIGMIDNNNTTTIMYA